jgi:hypothetical protein
MTNVAIRNVLNPAFEPCAGFAGACSSLKWKPEVGHCPRGFLGATGDLADVELVLVFAEPGDPHPSEKHDGSIDSPLKYAEKCFTEGRDLFHRNVRYVLDLCFPGETIEKQLRKAWLTESVLCSAAKEGGHVPVAASRNCSARYLVPQLNLLPKAFVAAMGAKAQRRLVEAGATNFFAAAAVAPPGASRPEAKASWLALAKKFHESRGDR